MKRFEIITEADARSIDVGATVELAKGGHVTPLARDTLAARRVTVTLRGEHPSPRASRCRRRAPSRTTSRGLSLRTVRAPTRIASHSARTASTRSRSSGLESSSRSSGAASR